MFNRRRAGRPRGRKAWWMARPSLVGAGLMLAACGGGSAVPSVAALSAGTPAHHRSAGALTPGQSDRDMVAFARCMRGHGVQMSDPFHRPGHQGLSIDMPTQDARSADAYRACGSFIEPDIEAKQRAAAGAAAPVLGALERYAACMRSHDIAMLDPTPQGSLSLGTVAGITDSFGRYSPQFRSADSACRRLLPPSVHDDGTGP